MTADTFTSAESVAAARRFRDRLAAVRERARKLFEGGATGIQVTAALAQGLDEFLLELLADALQAVEPRTRQMIEDHAAVVAIGGTGRGDPAPFSDVDLLLLYDGQAKAAFERVTAQLVRDCWDAGVHLGHALRTTGETLALAREESEVATALIHARRLWGSPALCERLVKRFQRRIVRSRARSFLAECIAAREAERRQFGGSATQLEPDVKKSAGGLRDVHLIRWIGYVRYGTADVDSLRLKGALTKKDARRLLAAQEFLTRIRCDLHFAAGRAQDVLTREEQLRLADERCIEAPVGQRPVEAFMQQYFRHSTAIAQVARRFVGRHRPASAGRKFLHLLASWQIDDGVVVRPDGLYVSPKRRNAACRNLENILHLFRSSAWHRVDVSPPVVEAIAQAEPKLKGAPTERAAELFLDILKRPGHLGPVLRSMHETSILELLVPNMAHARCLLQFNQYHHYTVDEHTLRTIEAVEAFESDDGPIGTAYRSIRHKEILHLALLLHDLGKGFGEDHSDVGAAIAETIARRLFLPDHHREILVFLVHRHLRMTHLAFRRDCSDPDLLMEFSREVGSPETLRMLYALSAADLSGVGPDVFNDWKADLLTDLFDRTMLILSGKPYRHHEERRIAGIKQQVLARLAASAGRIPNPSVEAETGTRAGVSTASEPADGRVEDLSYVMWAGKKLDAMPPHYLSGTRPERIAADLQILYRLQPNEVVVEGAWDAETGTVDYRVVVHASLTEGCFHRITGALTAKRLEILSAQISTSTAGTAVDTFRVMDDDYDGEVPPARIEEVAQSIRTALQPGTSVASLFRRFQRFGDERPPLTVSDQETRVAIDNDSSEQCTVIDVFAHDRRGLLYTLARAINELDLSVMLAKISTHLDQVVDVFYVTDLAGNHIRDGERLKHIRERLVATVEDFERDGYRTFLS